MRALAAFSASSGFEGGGGAGAGAGGGAGGAAPMRSSAFRAASDPVNAGAGGRGTGGGAHTPPKLAVSELLDTLGVGDESYQQWEVGMKAAEIVAAGHLSAMQQEGQPPHPLLREAPPHFIFEQVALLCHRLYLVNANQAAYHVVLKQRTGLSPVAAPP